MWRIENNIVVQFYIGLARRKLTFFVKLRHALLFFLKPHSQNAFGCSGLSARGLKLMLGNPENGNPGLWALSLTLRYMP